MKGGSQGRGVGNRRSQRIARAFVVVVALSGIPWAACEQLGLPQRTPGEKLYRKHCAKCHGVDARGNTPRYMGNADADLSDSSWAQGSGDDGFIHYIISNGIFGEMPAYPELTPEQRQQIVDHLRLLQHQARTGG